MPQAQRGRPRKKPEIVDYKAIERARLSVGRAISQANRGGTEPKFDREDVQRVLFGIIELMTENAGLRRKLAGKP